MDVIESVGPGVSGKSPKNSKLTCSSGGPSTRTAGTTCERLSYFVNKTKAIVFVLNF